MTRGKLGLSTSVAGLMLMGSVLAPSSPASAQIRLIPQVGLYVPQNDLGRVDGGSETVDIAKKESTLGYGASLELGASGMLGLRIGGVYGSQSDVAVSGVGCSGCAARSTVIALTGALVLRPLPSCLSCSHTCSEELASDGTTSTWRVRNSKISRTS